MREFFYLRRLKSSKKRHSCEFFKLFLKPTLLHTFMCYFSGKKDGGKRFIFSEIGKMTLVALLKSTQN